MSVFTNRKVLNPIRGMDAQCDELIPRPGCPTTMSKRIHSFRS